MKRREFITLVGVAAVIGPSTARAQQAAKLPTIGFSGPALWAPAFEQRLRELGWVAAGTRAHRGPRRGMSSCRYRCRSRRSRYWVSETWRAPCLWRPLPASLAGGAGARPDHPIRRHGRG